MVGTLLKALVICFIWLALLILIPSNLIKSGHDVAGTAAFLIIFPMLIILSAVLVYREYKRIIREADKLQTEKQDVTWEDGEYWEEPGMVEMKKYYDLD